MTYNLLFLCTGNYYRSRFAEHFFNKLVAETNLDWRATSRALALELGGRNVGPISHFAIEGLRQRGIELEKPIRFPRSLQLVDLNQATRIIALKEAEHRAMVEKRFSDWTARVEFWHIDDIDVAEPSDALAKLELGVRELIERLRTGK